MAVYCSEDATLNIPVLGETTVLSSASSLDRRIVSLSVSGYDQEPQDCSVGREGEILSIRRLRRTAKRLEMVRFFLKRVGRADQDGV